MFKKIKLLVFCSFVLLSCSKEATLKNKLSSGNGKWKVIHLERYIYAPSATGISGEYSCNNCGNFQFNKNKTGEMVLDNSAAIFNYSIADDGKKLILYIDGDGMVYDITWNWNKSEFTLRTDLTEGGFSQLITCKKS